MQEGLNRWLKRDNKPSYFPVKSATLLSIGDMSFQDENDEDDLKPASDEAWDSDLTTTRQNFKAHFAGVSQFNSLAGNTDLVKTGTAGAYQFKIASGTFKIGQMIAPAKHASEDELLNTTVAVTTVVAEAIGKIIKGEPDAVEKVVCEIFGQITAKPGT